MGATIIDGKALAAATKAEAAEKVKELKAQGINPCLAVILVGENPASQVYVRGKINDCAQCGIESCSINLPADTTQETLLTEVKSWPPTPPYTASLSSCRCLRRSTRKPLLTLSRRRRMWMAFRRSTWAVCRSASRATCPAPRRAASA